MALRGPGAELGGEGGGQAPPFRRVWRRAPARRTKGCIHFLGLGLLEYIHMRTGSEVFKADFDNEVRWGKKRVETSSSLKAINQLFMEISNIWNGIGAGDRLSPKICERETRPASRIYLEPLGNQAQSVIRRWSIVQPIYIKQLFV